MKGPGSLKEWRTRGTRREAKKERKRVPAVDCSRDQRKYRMAGKGALTAESRGDPELLENAGHEFTLTTGPLGKSNPGGQ